MANITSQMVKELREMTQAGMMDCKKALVEAEGVMEKAIEWLREKGLAAAAKKAGRIAAEGAVIDYVTEDKTVGAIVEVNCETDFVANTDNFKNFCKNIAKHIALSNPVDVDELMNQKFVDDESKTITDLVSDATVSIGEKISIRRFARYQTNCGVVETYIHMGGKIGVLLLVENNNPATFGADAFRTFYHERFPPRRSTRSVRSSAPRRSTRASPRRSWTRWSRAASRSTIRRFASWSSPSSRIRTSPSPS